MRDVQTNKEKGGIIEIMKWRGIACTENNAMIKNSNSAKTEIN